jgi:hypothetical protein
MIGHPETTDQRAWRGLDTAPEGVAVQVIVLGFVNWIYATYEEGVWRDANDAPIPVLAWRPANAD